MRTRHAAAGLLFALLAACAATNRPQNAAEPFCRVGDLTFHTDFEGAALHACAPGESGPVLTVAPEYLPINPSPWYAWRVTGEPGDSGQITITQRYLYGWHRYHPWTSTDGEQWARLPEGRVALLDDGSARFTLDVPPGGLLVAAQPPLTNTATQDWATALARDNGLREREIAESVGGRPVRAYETEVEGRHGLLVLIGRQHPPEVTGALAYRDFVGRLFANDDLASRFRARYAIGLLPALNPDGVAGGHWRTNERGVDLNRDWGPFTQPETRAAERWLAELHAQAPLSLFVDFHSTDQDVFYMPHASDDPAPVGFAAAWRDRLGRRLGDDMPAWSGEHNPGLPTSKSWVRRRYGVLAITYEVGDNTPRDHIRRAAVSAAEETMRLLLETEEATP
jgi:predicted deacylase